MKIWIRSRLNAAVSVAEVVGDHVRIGSHTGNDIVLDNRAIAGDALVLRRRNRDGWHLRLVGHNPCSVDSLPIPAGEEIPLKNQSHIDLLPYQLQVDWEDDAPAAIASLSQQNDDLARLIRDIHVRLLALMDLQVDDAQRRANHSYLLSLEHNIDEIADLYGKLNDRQELTRFIAGSSIYQSLCLQLVGSDGTVALLDPATEVWRQVISAVPNLEAMRDKIVRTVRQRMLITAGSDLSTQLGKVSQDFWTEWTRLAPSLPVPLLTYLAKRELKKQLKDIVFGYGPLEDLLRMSDISEIMVVDSETIFIERNGILENSGRRFTSDEVTASIIERIVARVGRRIDKSQPLVDARLSDGSRVNAVIPPITLDGPCLTIRKFPTQRLTVERLIEQGSLSAAAARFLEAAVVARKNLIVSGATGSGKTTLLNCLSGFIPDKERIVTIEDTAELQLSKQHVVRMETKPANAERKGAYEIRDLVKNALRMRPDRIVVGECRGGEALDMLQAMNTGHNGSLTTLHANNPEDAMLRLEVLVTTGVDLPIDSIRCQIASAVDLVVQIKRHRDGRRRVTHISEVVGLEPLTHRVELKHLFLQESVEGEPELLPTGYLPTFIEELHESNQLDLATFYN